MDNDELGELSSKANESSQFNSPSVYPKTETPEVSPDQHGVSDESEIGTNSGESTPNETSKRRLFPWLIAGAAVLFVVLAVATFVGFNSASNWHGKTNAQIERGDQLQGDLNRTQADLDETNSRLSATKDALSVTKTSLADLADKTKECVDHLSLWLDDMTLLLSSSGFYSGNDSLTAQTGTLCGTASATARIAATTGT